MLFLYLIQKKKPVKPRNNCFLIFFLSTVREIIGEMVVPLAFSFNASEVVGLAADFSFFVVSSRIEWNFYTIKKQENA